MNNNKKFVNIFLKIWPYMKKPSCFFAVAFIAGLLVDYYLLKTNIESNFVLKEIDGISTFVKVVKTNCIIIATIYISAAFTDKYAYFAYLINGIVLGMAIGWILRTNISLIMLIIPHGIFEILNILSTGYIAQKGRLMVKNKLKKYIICFFTQEVFTVFCAFIEAFITPLFLKII